MSLDILKDEIKTGKIRSLLLFCGPEEYLKKYYCESIEKLILKDDFKELNKITIDGKCNVNKLIDICETVPVFSDRKLIIIKNSGFFKSGKKSGEVGGKAKASDGELLTLLQNMPDHNCVIFYEEEIDKRIKAVDAVKKNGLIVEFPFQKPAELVKWVIKAFKSYKKDIDVITASQLVENCEQGMVEILSEVNKLALYSGEKTVITTGDVEKVSTKSIKSRIFDLTDAIAGKETTKALKLLNDMISLKEPIPRIMYMVIRQFRLMLQMKSLVKRGASPNDTASQLGITPYAAGKIAKQLNCFSEDQLKKALEDSLNYDLAIKTGKIDERIALELLISSF